MKCMKSRKLRKNKNKETLISKQETCINKIKRQEKILKNGSAPDLLLMTNKYTMIF